MKQKWSKNRSQPVAIQMVWKKNEKNVMYPYKKNYIEVVFFFSPLPFAFPFPPQACK